MHQLERAVLRGGPLFRPPATGYLRPVSMPADLAPFRLEEYLGVWEFGAPHHLTASDAESMSVAELLALAGPEESEAFGRLSLSYAPTWGGEELREAIAALYPGLGAEHVLTFAGAEEALFWALQELAGPGDHALVTVPNYRSFESIPLGRPGRHRGHRPRPRRRLGARRRRGRRPAAAEHHPGRGQLPRQPDRRGRRPGRLRGARRALRRPRRDAAQPTRSTAAEGARHRAAATAAELSPTALSLNVI